MTPQSQFELDLEMQSRVLDAAIKLNQLLIAAAASGLDVRINEHTQKLLPTGEVVQIHPQLFRLIERGE